MNQTTERSRPSRKALWVSILVIAILIAAFALFLYDGREKPTKHIRFGLTPYQDTALPVVAQDMGWFRERGIDIEFVPLAWGDVILSLSSGAIDASIYTFSSFQAPFESAATGANMPVFYCPIYVFKGTAIMIRENSGITPFRAAPGEPETRRKERLIECVKQLRGKRIAVTEGTEFEQIVLAALTLAGLDAKSDVQMINATPADSLAAFLSGNIDAFGAGLTERVEARKRGGTELLVSSDVGQPSIDGIVTTQKFARDHKDQLDALVRVWFKTVSYVGMNPKTNSDGVRKYLANTASTRYSPEEYAIAWTFNVFPGTPQEASALFQSPSSPYYWKKNWDANNEFLVTQKKIKSPVPESAYWGESVLRRLSTP